MCRVDELTNRLECIHRVIVKQEVGTRRNLPDLDGTRPEPGQIRQRLVGESGEITATTVPTIPGSSDVPTLMDFEFDSLD
jgi:hypothetical protein